MIEPGDSVTIAGSTFEIWKVLGSQPEPDYTAAVYRRDDQQRIRVLHVDPKLLSKVSVEEGWQMGNLEAALKKLDLRDNDCRGLRQAVHDAFRAYHGGRLATSEEIREHEGHYDLSKRIAQLEAELAEAKLEAGKQAMVAEFYLEGLNKSSNLNDAARELYAAFPREAPAAFNIPGYLVTNLENAIKLDDEMKGRHVPQGGEEHEEDTSAIR